MRFTCLFAHEERRAEEITIAVELTQDEIRAIRVLRSEADPHLWTKIQAYALSHAYRMAPEGFQHIRGGVRQLQVH
jgi:hypothetical protein